MKEGFPDGKVPVSSLRMDYDSQAETFYYHIDISALTKRQSDFLVALGRKKFGAAVEGARDEDILARACVKQSDTCCPDCGAEGKHDCQASSTIYDQLYEEEREYYEDDDYLEEGELNLFPSMPWINQNVGSTMEAQLLRYGDDGQCRQCGKFFEKLKGASIENRFCSEACSNEWHHLMEARIAQGKHDLRVRGYD
jgi:hypothetical protein